MSISSEIARITNAKNAIASAISNKGVTVPDGAKIDDMPALIDNISGGGNYQSKSVTFTSNGTATITPDAGYDALSEVNVTVDVSGGGGVETCTLTVKVGEDIGGIDTACVYATAPDGAQSYDTAGTYTILKNSVLGAYSTMYIQGSYQALSASGLLRLCKATGDLTIMLLKGL